MKKNDGYKKIKSLFYIVAIISMIIAIVGKVRAESIPDYVQDIYDSYIDEVTNIDDETKQAVKDYIDTFEYSYMAEFLNNEKTDVRERIIYLTNYSNMGFCSWFGWNNYGSQFFNGTRTSGSRWDEGGVTLPDSINVSNAYYSAIIITYETNNKTLYCNKFVPQDKVQKSSYSVWLYYSHYRTTGVTNVPVCNTDSLPYNYSNHGDASYIKCYLYEGSDSLRYFYSSEYDRFSGIKDMKDLSNIEYLEEPVLYDDNFIIYKSYGAGGISDPLLNIQYADNIFSQGYTYTSSTIYNLTFDVDGTETTVSISSSVYPDDFLENGSFRTSFDLIYRMLSNKIVNFSSADTVTLTAVSMSATAYPTSSMQGTPETVTKSTLCNLVLKGSEGGEDIESDIIPAVSDVTIVYDQVSNSGDFYNHSGTWHNDVTIPDWAECYTIVIHGNYFPSGFDLGFSYDWLVDHQTFSKFQFLGYVDPTYINIQNAQVDYYDNLEFHKTDIIECIKFLGLLNSCDVVRIIVGDTDITGNTWTTVQDNIFFMSSYYQKLSIKGLGNIQSAVESGTYYTKVLYWYTKDRLDNMSGYLAYYTKKSLSNQTVQNGYLQSINTNIISIKDSIDTGVNSIVSAISGISGGSSSYSLPSLSTELQRLFIPTLTWQSIDFDDYMDSLGVLSLPFTFTNDVLTVADSSYSSTLDLHINDFSLDVTGSNDVLTIFEDQDYSFNPRSIFANDVWTMLTYLNAFALILGEAWVTYCHIFRRDMSNDC